MGTRSTFRFIEKGKDENGKVWKRNYILVYFQYDGYPVGRGLDVAKWLTTGTLVNGININETRLVFNGTGCLAAQFVAKFKEGAGGCYIYPLSDRGYAGENYLYDVIVEDFKITFVCRNNNKSKSIVFSGTPEEFIEKYGEKEEKKSNTEIAISKKVENIIKDGVAHQK
jgi:hypothetical protein